MKRLTDLQDLIHSSLDIIKQHEELIQTAHEPEERLRSQRWINRHWENVADCVMQARAICLEMNQELPQWLVRAEVSVPSQVMEKAMSNSLGLKDEIKDFGATADSDRHSVEVLAMEFSNVDSTVDNHRGVDPMLHSKVLMKQGERVKGLSDRLGARCKNYTHLVEAKDIQEIINALNELIDSFEKELDAADSSQGVVIRRLQQQHRLARKIRSRCFTLMDGFRVHRGRAKPSDFYDILSELPKQLSRLADKL